MSKILRYKQFRNSQQMWFMQYVKPSTHRGKQNQPFKSIPIPRENRRPGNPGTDWCCQFCKCHINNLAYCVVCAFHDNIDFKHCIFFGTINNFATVCPLDVLKQTQRATDLQFFYMLTCLMSLNISSLYCRESVCLNLCRRWPAVRCRTVFSWLDTHYALLNKSTCWDCECQICSCCITRLTYYLDCNQCSIIQIRGWVCSLLN